MSLKLLPMSEVDVKCLPLFLPTFPFFWRGLLTEPRLHCLSRLTGHRDLKILLTTSVVLGLQGHATILAFTWLLWI